MHLLDGYDFILIDLSAFVFFVTLTFLFLKYSDTNASEAKFFRWLKYNQEQHVQVNSTLCSCCKNTCSTSKKRVSRHSVNGLYFMILMIMFIVHIDIDIVQTPQSQYFLPPLTASSFYQPISIDKAQCQQNNVASSSHWENTSMEERSKQSHDQ